MIAKKRRTREQVSRRNDFIVYGMLGVFTITLVISLFSSDFVRQNIPIIIFGFLFIGIILIFVTMKRDGGQQDIARVVRRVQGEKVRKEKKTTYHYDTLDQDSQADGKISSIPVRADQDSREKSGKGSAGTEKSSSDQIKTTKKRTSPEGVKKMQDTSEEEEISLPADEQQDNTPIYENVWDFPSELLDRYEPLGVLGDDAYAQVYLVRNKKNDKIRSLKLSKSTEPASEIVKKESGVWRNMSHPNISTLYLSEFDQFKFLENEYVPGVLYKGERYLSLSELPKPIKEKYVLSIILDISRALAYTHNLGLRHYHLQPGNILITPKLEAKVSGYSRGKNEFGFATGYATIDIHHESDESLAHFAPEQREGSHEKLSTRTDLFQLGIIFYELLTGYKPYTKRLYQFVHRNADEEQIENEYEHLFIPPSRISSTFAPYDTILQKLIAQSKKERYSSIKDLIADLKQMHPT